MAEPAASKDAEVGTSTRASTWETSSTRTSWVTLRDFLAALWNFLAVVGDRGLGGATEIYVPAFLEKKLQEKIPEKFLK